MNTADLITAYLNNEMTPEQERQFLLSVAASDQLRLALKSHVMLDRIVLREAQEIQVPVALRSAILARAAGTAAMPVVSSQSVEAPPRLPGLSVTGMRNGALSMVVALGLFAGGYATRLGMEDAPAERPDGVGVALEAKADSLMNIGMLSGSDKDSLEVLPEQPVAGIERARAEQRGAGDAAERRSGRVVRVPRSTRRTSGPGEVASSTTIKHAVRVLDNPLSPATDRVIPLQALPMGPMPESTAVAPAKIKRQSVTLDEVKINDRQSNQGDPTEP